MRLRGRHVSRQMILDAMDRYEMIESYPMDKCLPSYLVLARHGDKTFHVLFATDVDNDHVRVITAYEPDPEEWYPDLKNRRSKK